MTDENIPTSDLPADTAAPSPPLTTDRIAVVFLPLVYLWLILSLGLICIGFPLAVILIDILPKRFSRALGAPGARARRQGPPEIWIHFLNFARRCGYFFVGFLLLMVIIWKLFWA